MNNNPTNINNANVRPKTNTHQIIDNATGKTLAEILDNIGGVGGNIKPFSLIATAVGQKDFTFTDADFDKENSVTFVFMNGEFMHPTEEYTIDKVGDIVTVKLVTGLDIGDQVYVIVNPFSGGGSGGGNFDINDVPNRGIPLAKIDMETPTEFIGFGGTNIYRANKIIHIDPVNGQDTNSGDLGASIKTLDKLGKMLSNTRSLGKNSIDVLFYPGNYEGSLTIINFGRIALAKYTVLEGEVNFINPDMTANPNWTASIHANYGEVMVIKDLSFTPKKLKPEATLLRPITLENINKVRIQRVNVNHDGIDESKISSASAGITTDNCRHVIIESTNFDKMSTPIYTDSSKVFLGSCKFTDTGEVIANFATTVTQFHSSWINPRSNAQVRTLNKAFNMDSIQKGAVVESGFNGNGSYRVFGDGTIEISRDIGIGNGNEGFDKNIVDNGDGTYSYIGVSPYLLEGTNGFFNAVIVGVYGMAGGEIISTRRPNNTDGMQTYEVKFSLGTRTTYANLQIRYTVRP